MKCDSPRCWALAAALTAALCCIDASAASVRVSDPPTPAMLLAQGDQLYLSDYHRFLGILKQLHQEEKQLTPAQHWHLTYLDALQRVYAAENAKATPLLHEIIEHSGAPSLSARATALLIQVDFLGRRYEQAYELAGTLIAELPGITDPDTRLSVLGKVVQMMDSVGQFDLALKYAREIKASFPSAKGQCEGKLYETQSLEEAGKLGSDSPEYEETIDTCLAANQAVFANALRLDRAYNFTDEGHPERAIALLQQIAPSIREAGYQPHIAELPAYLAMAYVRQGNDTEARKSALAALALTAPGSTDFIVQAANQVLYQVEKRAGHDAAALSYYEKYSKGDKESADDAKLRALAYQEVKQEVLAKKMKLDALGKQNRILQLRQALAIQAQKASRLYIALLLVVIAFITLAMFWLRRSQLRFRRMARHDGLTGTFNREHFFDEAGRTLRRLHKARAGVCLVVLDMDHFKQVNDTHGHAAGDEVLRRTVLILRQELRASDVLGRLGGEEFGILIPACSREQGIEIVTRICRTLATTSMVLDPQTTITVSASFGLAHRADSDCTLRQLLIDADAALYRAKDGGRNQVVVDTRAYAPVAASADDRRACKA